MQRAVEALAIIKDFDPFEDRRSGLRPRGELATMNQVPFECAPEAFHHRVVVTVASSAHAGNDSSLGQPLPVGVTGVLNPAIGVMD